MTHRRAVWGLVIVAFVWGCSFSIIKGVLALLTPLVLLSVRFTLAALIASPGARGITRREFAAGVVLGALFCGGFIFQTVGLAYTTPSRSAFITGLSSPLVPLIAFAVYRAAPRALTMLGIVLAAVGMYFLTQPGTDAGPAPETIIGGLNRGDLLTLGCAVLFAAQIVTVGRFAKSVPAGRLLAVELGVTAVIATIAAFALESPKLTMTPGVVAAMLFLSVSAVATFYFQLRAQTVVSAAQTALIFTLEPVFAAIASYFAFGEVLTPMQWVGAALILAGMVAPELKSDEEESAAIA